MLSDIDTLSMQYEYCCTYQSTDEGTDNDIMNEFYKILLIESESNGVGAAVGVGI